MLFASVPVFTEWGAIAWVSAGITAGIALYAAIRKLIDKHDAKVKAQVTIDNKVNAYFTRTDELSTAVEALEKATLAVTNTVTNLMQQRMHMAEYEAAKAEALHTLLEHHKTDSPEILLALQTLNHAKTDILKVAAELAGKEIL